MSLARGAAVGALGAAVLVLAFVLLGGGGGHQYRVLFQTAGQLVKGDEVQVGGHGVGSVEAISLTKENQAAVDISVDDEFAPLHEGTSAVVRLTSLSGVANRYIQLTLGPNSNAKIPDNGTITQDHTTSVVDLDQIFDTLDAPTRTGLAGFIRGQGDWYKGKVAQANLSAYYFNPALSTSSDVFSQLSDDQPALSTAVTATAGAMKAIASRRDDLSSAVQNTNQFAGSIAAENSSFSQALAILPATLRRANSTFVDLRGTLDSVQSLVDVSKPNTVGLAGFLTALRPAASRAVPVLSTLATMIYSKGSNNDLIDTFVNAPVLQALANDNTHSSFPESINALQKGQDTIEFARPYTVDLVGWVREFGQATAFYDSNGHYARVSPAFNAYKYDSGTQALDVLDADKRLSIYEDAAFGGHGTGNNKRCPGAAAAAPTGMTWPFLSGGATGCDPNQVLPG
ncbi:MAG: MlaD family protein [Solirubrobacterales bacterium]|nr:MlaD family protein [Solirubrobacterales bacterium]